MIKAYIGLPGTGKTLNMVRDVMNDLKRGIRVITNTPIFFKEKGIEYRAEYVSSSKEFADIIKREKNCKIAIDEASIFFPSNFWQRLQGEFIIKFAQTRKFGLDLYYTTQGYNHTIKRLRDLTNVVGKCRVTRIPFTPYQIHTVTWYDPEFFQHQILNKERVKEYIIQQDTMWPPEFKKVIQAYNTLHTVEASALFDTDDRHNQSFISD